MECPEDDWLEKRSDETDQLTSELQRRGIELPNGPALCFDDLEEQSGTLEEIEVSYECYVPATRATRVDQIQALRYE